MTGQVVEYWEPDETPHDALGRAARLLVGHGALSLGGGIGVERHDVGDGRDRYAVLAGGRVETYAGPLAATTRAFELAGRSTAPDSPGGETVISSPSVAARVRELEAKIADLERVIERLRSASSGFGVVAPDPEAWDSRELAKRENDLRDARRELRRLLRQAKGPVSEALGAAIVGKPGTNWIQVSPAARKKLSPIIRHYMTKPHPFTACVRDNTKRFGRERAERICAVVKDLGMRTTRWRKGGKKLSEDEIDAALAELVAEARKRVEVVEAAVGPVGVMRLVEGDYEGDELNALAEGLWQDMGLLWLAGEGPAPFVSEAFSRSTPARDARRRLGSAQRRPPRPGMSLPRTVKRWDESKVQRAPKGSPRGGQFIAKGARGQLVRRIQRRLGITADGSFGPETRQAIIDFQRRHGLRVDGIIGRQTALALAGRFQRARQLGPGALRASDMRLLRGLLPASARNRRAGGGWTV